MDSFMETALLGSIISFAIFAVLIWMCVWFAKTAVSLVRFIRREIALRRRAKAAARDLMRYQEDP